jgi:repressor LexA
VLTQRQRQLLQFIERYVAERGVPPSFEEMRDALKLRSKSGIHRLIIGLEERGYIRRLPYRARALELTRAAPPQQGGRGPVAVDADPTNVVQGPFRGRHHDGVDDDAAGANLPLYGRIAAGTPIEALRDHSTHVSVPPHLVGSGDHYALEVVGDSMVDAGIQDGDIVVIQCVEIAENGDIVVALIDDTEATLKRLRSKGQTVALEAANPAYETRIFGAHRVKIQGRLTGLMRRY